MRSYISFILFSLIILNPVYSSQEEGGEVRIHVQPANYEKWTIEDLEEEYADLEKISDDRALLYEGAEKKQFETDLQNRSCYRTAGRVFDNLRATLGYATPVAIGVVNLVPIDPGAKQWASIGIAIFSLGVNAIGHLSTYYTTKANDISIAYEHDKNDRNSRKKVIADIIREKKQEQQNRDSDVVDGAVVERTGVNPQLAHPPLVLEKGNGAPKKFKRKKKTAGANQAPKKEVSSKGKEEDVRKPVETTPLVMTEVEGGDDK